MTHDNQSTTPIKARQGRAGRPIFLVLAGGIILACIAGVVVYFAT